MRGKYFGNLFRCRKLILVKPPSNQSYMALIKSLEFFTLTIRSTLTIWLELVHFHICFVLNLVVKLSVKGLLNNCFCYNINWKKYSFSLLFCRLKKNLIFMELQEKSYTQPKSNPIVSVEYVVKQSDHSILIFVIILAKISSVLFDLWTALECVVAFFIPIVLKH